MREITFLQALNEAMAEEMRRDPTVFLMGEGVRLGAFGVTTGLVQEFGPERVLDTGISETVIAGSAVGAALAGTRPIAEIMFSDFASVCYDEICTKAARWGYTHGRQGGMIVPIVYRAICGGYGHWGAEHSGANLAIYKHNPGLKIALPSNPYDAKGLLKTAIRDNNPVVFLEHTKLLNTTGPVPEEEYTVPFGRANILRKGTDVTVVATGYMTTFAMQVAQEFEKDGISLEVIDPRTIEPLDAETLLDSARKTGRVVLVDEDTKVCSITAEIGMQIVEEAFYYLKAPVKRVGAANIPIPGSPPLEEAAMVQPADISAAVTAVLKD